jgi:hypothetical protein
MHDNLLVPLSSQSKQVAQYVPCTAIWHIVKLHCIIDILFLASRSGTTLLALTLNLCDHLLPLSFMLLRTRLEIPFFLRYRVDLLLESVDYTSCAT